MKIRTNMESMYSNRQLGKNNHLVGKSIEKLASGYAINRAADDAAGLAISEKMRSQITGLDQGTDNALDGVCLIQTAEGGMVEIHSMLNRITELATKSANGTIQDEVDRHAIQAEVDVLVDEIDRIAQATNYNGIPLLDGSLGSGGSGGNNIYVVPTNSYYTEVGFMIVDVDLSGLMGSDLIGNEMIIQYENSNYDITLSTTIVKFKSIDSTNNSSYPNMGAITTDPTNGINEIIMYIDPDISAIDAVSAFRVNDEQFVSGRAPVYAVGTTNSGAWAGTPPNTNGFYVQGYWGGNTNQGVVHVNLTLNDFMNNSLSNGELILHVGDQNATYNKVKVAIDSMRASALGIDPLDVSSQTSSGQSIDVVKGAINRVSTNRANLGALQNRLECTINTNKNTIENMESAKSVIKDCDMAKEMMEYTKMGVLVQSAQSMLTQSNQAPQSILSLLG